MPVAKQPITAVWRDGMGRIFISYRREDSESQAGRLADLLRQRFGEAQVFMDVDTIDPGQDFIETIQSAVGSCDVLIAVIGPEWLTVTDRAGRRRIDVPEDVVRLEVAAALDRQIRVIPLLVRRATMPSMQDLPAALGPLARRNALEVTDTHFRRDVDRLVETLERLPGVRPAGPALPPASGRRRRWIAAGVGLAIVATAVLTVGWLLTGWRRPAERPVAVGLPPPVAGTQSRGLGRFDGVWKNVDPATRGLTMLEITVAGEKVWVRASGKCHPTDCDWGRVAATAYAPDIATSVTRATRAVTATFETTFSETTLTLRPTADDTITSETVTRFTDKSGRAPYSATETFRQATR
jgi:hypothetical protein